MNITDLDNRQLSRAIVFFEYGDMRFEYVFVNGIPVAIAVDKYVRHSRVKDSTNIFIPNCKTTNAISKQINRLIERYTSALFVGERMDIIEADMDMFKLNSLSSTIKIISQYYCGNTQYCGNTYDFKHKWYKTVNYKICIVFRPCSWPFNNNKFVSLRG